MNTKTIIRVMVIDQKIQIVDAPLLASGGENEAVVVFDFCEKWDGFAKTATFYQDESKPYSVILDNEDTCVVPWEVYYEAGTFYFGVFGNKGEIRRTSNVVKYKVKRGAATDTIPSAPTPEVYEQIMAAVAEVKTEQELFITNIEGVTDASVEAANQAADNASRVAQELTEARVNGEFKGEKGEKGEKGDRGSSGSKGDTGDSGVHMGSTMPSDPAKNVWIKTDYAPVEQVNALTKAVDEEHSPYIGLNGEVGYSHGYFYDEDQIVYDDYSIHCVTGYIPATNESKVRFTDIVLDDMGTTMALYDEDFNLIAVGDIYVVSGEFKVEKDENGYITFIDFSSFAGTDFGGVDAEVFANIAYFRTDMYQVGENPFIYVDTIEGNSVVSDNILHVAINEDGTPCNGFSSGIINNNGEEISDEEYLSFYSGFIPVTPTSKLHFSGMKFDNMEYGIQLYDRNFNYIRTNWCIFDYVDDAALVKDAVAFNDRYNEILWVDFARLFSANYGEATPNELKNTAYIRLTGIVEYTANCAVTIEMNASVLYIRNADGSFHPVPAISGYTPVKGVDYWTDAEKAEIKAYIDAIYRADKIEEWKFFLEDGTSVVKQVVVK